ncbi:MAG: hypothetical protein AB1716_09285 [Planctomycetota bacterium]
MNRSEAADRLGSIARRRRAVVVGLVLASASALAALSGCVKAPEKIVIPERMVDIRMDDGRSEPVDAAPPPPTASDQGAQVELERAYKRIEQLERENARLERKAAEYKRERDEARDRLERIEEEQDD